MPVTLTLEGLLVGVPASAVVVALVRWRWRAPSSVRRRQRRLVVLVVLGVITVVAWPLLMVALMFAAAFLVALFLLGVVPRRGAPGHYGVTRPARYRPRQARPQPGGEGEYRYDDRDYERRVAEEVDAMAARDDQQRRDQYEWDQYRWGNRAVPPGGPEIW